MADTTKTTADQPEADDTAKYAREPMYIAGLAHKEIRDLSHAIDKLASRYDFKDGVEARLVTELLKMAGHALDRVSFSDLVAVEKANPAE